MPKYTNGRMNIDASEDFSPFGATFASLMGIVEDRLDEFCNTMSATEDADDLAVSDIAYTSTLVGTSTSATALAVGPSGTTNPTFKVVCSTTSAATGIGITGAAAAGGVAVAVLSSGTNENLTIDAKGSGTITLNATGTGGIILTRAVTCSSTLGAAGMTNSSTYIGTVANANGLTVGRQGSTNPALQVNTATGSCTTGISITAAAGNGHVAVAAISDQTNEQLAIDSKGSDNLVLNGTATGTIQLGSNVGITNAKNVALSATTGTKIGTAVTQKIGFWNAAPVAQQADSTQALVTTSVTTAATTTNLKTTVAAIIVLLNRIRLDLVTTGIIKGAAA